MRTFTLILINIVISFFICIALEASSSPIDADSKALFKRLSETKLNNLQIAGDGIEKSILIIKHVIEKDGKAFCPVVLKLESSALARPINVNGSMYLYQVFETIAEQANAKVCLKRGVVYFVDRPHQ